MDQASSDEAVIDRDRFEIRRAPNSVPIAKWVACVERFEVACRVERFELDTGPPAARIRVEWPEGAASVLVALSKVDDVRGWLRSSSRTAPLYLSAELDDQRRIATAILGTADRETTALYSDATGFVHDGSRWLYLHGGTALTARLDAPMVSATPATNARKVMLEDPEQVGDEDLLAWWEAWLLRPELAILRVGAIWVARAVMPGPGMRSPLMLTGPASTRLGLLCSSHFGPGFAVGPFVEDLDGGPPGAVFEGARHIGVTIERRSWRDVEAAPHCTVLLTAPARPGGRVPGLVVDVDDTSACWEERCEGVVGDTATPGQTRLGRAAVTRLVVWILGQLDQIVAFRSCDAAEAVDVFRRRMVTRAGALMAEIEPDVADPAELADLALGACLLEAWNVDNSVVDDGEAAMALREALQAVSRPRPTSRAAGYDDDDLLGVLHDALANGRAHIAMAGGGPPVDPDVAARWGWTVGAAATATPNGTRIAVFVVSPSERVPGFAMDHVAIYAVAHSHIPIRLNAVNRRLNQLRTPTGESLLALEPDQPGRWTRRMQIDGEQRALVFLDPAKFGLPTPFTTDRRCFTSQVETRREPRS